MPNLDWLRKYCLTLPHATEHIQWGHDLVFKAGGKMFAVMPLEPARVWLSFKCSPEEFTEMVERPGIIPAPYMARAYWVSLEIEDALTRQEIRDRLRRANELVFASLPKKTQKALNAPA
jgi:predicted DNA-binding protein (MmcQ/YjbR family)